MLAVKPVSLNQNFSALNKFFSAKGLHKLGPKYPKVGMPQCPRGGGDNHGSVIIGYEGGKGN